MMPVVSHYLPWLGPNERLHTSQLEIVVEKWLDDMARGGEPPGAAAAFRGTDFRETIKGAWISRDARP